MINVLISGSSGFVGQNIGKFLERKKISVCPLSRAPSATGITPAGTVFWDDLSAEKLDRFEVIIHLAGKAHDTRNTAHAAEYFAVNTGLTKKLFDAFLSSPATTFIYMSSVKAATDTVEDVLTEDIEPAPKTPYGQSKLKAEEYLLSQSVPAGKRMFVLRPCMIHGPGNKGNLNLLYKFVQKGVPYPLAAYDNLRSFLSIDNLNFIIERLVSDESIPGGIYNLADDAPLSTNAVIKIVAEVNQTRPRLWKIGRGLINSIAKAGDKLHLPLNSERLKKLTESYVVSNEKIKKALGIKMLPVSSGEGLKQTIRSFQ